MDTVIELEIGAGPTSGTFDVHVVRSLSRSEPSSVVTLDVDSMIAGLPQLETSILASSVSARRVMTASESAIQSMGVTLFDTVFAGKIGEAYRASAAVAAEHGLVPQVALRLTVPALAALPWEALYDSEAGRYISRKEPLIRRVSAPYTADPIVVTPPLRILAMVSAPRGLDSLDVEAEKRRLEFALREHLAEGRVELTWLDDVSWSGIQDKLLREPWHVLHFIGHGGYDNRADEGLVALVGRDGRADFVSASSLADLLMEAQTAPRLVVLNTCESGTTGSSDLFAGTAASLVRSGIHAVVAMQFAVTDYAAVAFARSFYVALASGRRIGEAVRSGRIGILGTTRDTLEWITPVLYLRGDDAQLLEAAEPKENGSGNVPLLTSTPGQDSQPPRQPDAKSLVQGDSTNAPGAEHEVVAQPLADLELQIAPESMYGAATEQASLRDVSAPIHAQPTKLADHSSRDMKRWTWIGLIVAAVVVAGGLGWGAAAVWDGLTSGDDVKLPTSPASQTPSSTPTPTIDPALQLAVPAATDWTATGVSCGAGDSLAITASGTILHDPNPTSTVTPDGLLTPEGLPDPNYLQYNVPGVPDAATASLIGSLDKLEPFFVGSNATYLCPRAGELFLGINDMGLNGNSGAWDVSIVKTDNPPLG